MTESPQTQPTNLNPRTTQTVEVQTTQAEEKSKLFFLRRRPRRHLDREWSPPPPEQYEKDLLNEGFIAEKLLQHPLTDDLKVDLRELNQHLLPHFWRMNQRAKYYQNHYYLYQWAFIVSAFCTTAFAAINVFMYAQGWAGWFDLAIIRLRWTELLGMATAVISGVAAAVSFLDANETPQKRWFTARSQAEALRSIYFLFLARQKPYDTLNTGERVQIMRLRVLEVLRGGTRASGSDQGSALDAPTPEEDAEAEAAETPTRRTNPPSGS
jgi:hypothetical protein